MTPERAQYILANRLMGGDFRYAFRFQYQGNDALIYDDGITADEHHAAKTLWLTMPGYTCFYDAIVRISKNENASPTAH